MMITKTISSDDVNSHKYEATVVFVAGEFCEFSSEEPLKIVCAVTALF